MRAGCFNCLVPSEIVFEMFAQKEFFRATEPSSSTQQENIGKKGSRMPSKLDRLQEVPVEGPPNFIEDSTFASFALIISLHFFQFRRANDEVSFEWPKLVISIKKAVCSKISC